MAHVYPTPSPHPLQEAAGDEEAVTVPHLHTSTVNVTLPPGPAKAYPGAPRRY